MQKISHKVLLLRPMQAGASGFARLYRDSRQAVLQIRVRGIGQEGFQAFWHEGGGTTVLLGSAVCDARGEALLTAQLPEECVPLSPGRLQALLLVENRQQPGPLMIGLCTESSAGSMLDARNACLMLCESLRVKTLRGEKCATVSAANAEKAVIHPQEEANPSANAGNVETVDNVENAKDVQDAKEDVRPKTVGEHPSALMEEIWRALAGLNFVKRQMPRREPAVLVLTEEKPAPQSAAAPEPDEPPREIFLTAIDPLVYVQATDREDNAGGNAVMERKEGPKNPCAQDETTMKTASQGAPRKDRQEPADGLPELDWPPFAKPLRDYFRRYRPTGLFSLPGWRFVCVSRQGDGLWVGRKAEEGKVSRIAYAMRGAPAKASEYQPLKGTDGKEYRVLVQRV